MGWVGRVGWVGSGRVCGCVGQVGGSGRSGCVDAGLREIALYLLGALTPLAGHCPVGYTYGVLGPLTRL